MPKKYKPEPVTPKKNAFFEPMEGEELEARKKELSVRGRGGKKNLPNVIDQSILTPGVIKKVGTSIMRWWKREPVKTEDELAERLDEFFVTCIENDEIPTFEKLCLAIGYTRGSVLFWETGEVKCTPTWLSLIKKAKEVLANFEAELAASGEIDRTVYIFRSKNYFGMRDEVVLANQSVNPLGDLTNPKAVKARIEASMPKEIPVEIEVLDKKKGE